MIIVIKTEVQRPNIFHLKAFGMINLQYEIRICQKIYNKVTMTVYVKCVVRFNAHQTLVNIRYENAFCNFTLFEKYIHFMLQNT